MQAPEGPSPPVNIDLKIFEKTHKIMGNTTVEKDANRTDGRKMGKFKMVK